MTAKKKIHVFFVKGALDIACNDNGSNKYNNSNEKNKNDELTIDLPKNDRKTMPNVNINVNVNTNTKTNKNENKNSNENKESEIIIEIENYFRKSKNEQNIEKQNIANQMLKYMVLLPTSNDIKIFLNKIITNDTIKSHAYRKRNIYQFIILVFTFNHTKIKCVQLSKQPFCQEFSYIGACETVISNLIHVLWRYDKKEKCVIEKIPTLNEWTNATNQWKVAEFRLAVIGICRIKTTVHDTQTFKNIWVTKAFNKMS